jgi:UDP-glucose 4-epimerase
MTKVLISGVAGFIGSHLGDYLLDKGYEVVGIDNLVSGKKENVHNDISVYDKSDIQDEGRMSQIIRAEKPDYIFHLAAVSRTPWSISEPLYTYRNNVVGSANILNAALEAGVKKVVLASSNIVYAAQTPYKSSKLAMEMVARDYNDLYDLPTLCLRFANVYGSDRQHEDNVLAALSKSKKEKGKITITGDGEQSRDFVHVLDVCRALEIAALSDVRGDEIDICTGKMWTLNEVAKFYNCPIEYIADRKGDIKILQMQGPAKAQDLLGFRSEFKLDENMKVYTDV